MDNDFQELQVDQMDLTQYQRLLLAKENDVELLNARLKEANNKLSLQETENASLKRLVERSNFENDELLEKLDHYENNEKTLNEEIAILKEALTESTMARDDVIEKLKDVSIETRELIDNCDKAYKENEIFKNNTNELEGQIQMLKQMNDSLRWENENLHVELETRNVEIKFLQHKLESFNSQSSPTQENDLWRNDISTVNNELQNIEKQIRKIIANLRTSETAKRNLEQEIQRLKSQNVNLRDQHAIKDELISKQNTDFLEMKANVDLYCSEIRRLDTELKDCHKRVATLNENLQTISSENIDLVEFMHFKRSLMRFGDLESIESLLSKLQVLQEIEQFFEKNLSPHVEPTNNHESDSNNSIVTDKKQDTINKIKNYLEKALFAIEKLNDKMTRLQNEYENKLRAKTSEISTLREVLSNATLYSKILEQTLQQYKENVQLDKAIGNETDELLIVNETLVDGFDTLKQLYRVSEQSNRFLFAKSEQLKFFTKLLELYVRRSFQDSDESRMVINREKISELFLLMRNFFDEISVTEPNAQKLIECQQVVEKCERSLITKDYLKNTVENISQEVKRLTSKVEHEMAEKIREIEDLKGEVDSVKVDNRELVNKIKSCNREIVSLSTENYDLNEKLESLIKIENCYHGLKRELDKVKKRMSSGDVPSRPNECIREKLLNFKGVCDVLKNENRNIRHVVEMYVKENRNVLSVAREFLRSYAIDLSKRDQSEYGDSNGCDLIQQQEDSEVVSTFLSKGSLEASLISLRDTCDVLKKENDDLRAGITMFVNLTSNDVIPGLHSTFTQLLKNIDATAKQENDFKTCISASIESIAAISDNVCVSNRSVRSAYEEMASEFSKQMQSVVHDLQKAVILTFENIKSSFAISNDEMIKEMQEMNAELKKRGEMISSLTQSLADSDKKNGHLLERISLKENAITELNDNVNDQLKKLEDIRAELEDAKLQYTVDVGLQRERVDDLTAKLENLNDQIRAKDDTITTLKNDIQKQKEMHDGDVSSVGTLSRTEEVSRLKDVEDTFEERYMKLKIIAVKMKKNIADLNQELQNEKAERSALQMKLMAVAKQAKISQVLQEECDKLNDDLEFKDNEIRELKKIIQASDKGGENFKSHIDSLRKELEMSEQNLVTLQNEKSELEVKMKTTIGQLETLSQEKLAEEIVKKEKDKEILLLKQNLKELEEVKGKVQNELDKAKKEIRKQGALTLEMQDFEKTISDLKTDVKTKETLIKELRVKLASTVDRNESLVETIKQLEEQISSYIESNKIADKQILTLNKTISEHERNLKEKEARLKQIIQQMENEKSTNESLTLQVANSTSEMKSLKDSFHEKEASLTEQAQSFRSKLLALQDTLSKKENEYGQLQEDYEAYKARAHNLLQKMKNENNVKSNEQRFQKEIDTLNQTVRNLKTRLDSTTHEIRDQKTQIELMETAKEKLQERIKELTISLSEKSEEIKATKAEYKAHKLNTDTLVNCYKTEIGSLKISLEEMKAELQKVKTEKVIVNPDQAASDEVTERIKTPNSECCDNGTVCNSSVGSRDSELENIDEAKTLNKRRKHSLVPLEKLLQPSKEESERESFKNENETQLRASVKSLEEQVKYLRSILNDSEKNAARNEQQVTLLKEEIRRLQRVFEREPHLRNTEYLKNVLIKFVTLPAGDEKSQLVTVLETILKLTSNEKQTLSLIAKGQKLDQKLSAGWTSYLGW